MIQVYNVHPLSPRDAFEDLRGDGLRTEVLRGRLFQRAGAMASLATNADLRRTELEVAVADSRLTSDPVIFAGDTNLPALSWSFARTFEGFQDGFTEAGSGFGYTFPANKRTWMRIDRVIADAHFRFLNFKVIKDRASDHLAVVADLELRPSDQAGSATSAK